MGGGGLVDLTGLLIAVDEFAEEGVDGHDWIWIGLLIVRLLF